MKIFLHLLAAGFLSIAAFKADAQTYPNRVVRVIVPYPPGGTVDTVARVVAQRLSEQLGQSFIVENRAGANGVIGSDVVAKATADGYTLLVQASTFVTNPILLKNLPYDMLRDFTPISKIGSVPPLVTAYPGVPAANLKEFFALVRATTYPPVKSGKLKALAVTSPKRIAFMPNVPTVAESGLPGFDMVSWYGVWGPANLPKDLAKKIAIEVGKAVMSPLATERLGDQGFDAGGTTPEEFATFLDQEFVKYSRVIKEANIKAE